MTVLTLYPNVLRQTVLMSALMVSAIKAIVYSKHANIAKIKGTVPQLAIYVHQEVYQENAMQTAILVNMTHF